MVFSIGILLLLLILLLSRCYFLFPSLLGTRVRFQEAEYNVTEMESSVHLCIELVGAQLPNTGRVQVVSEDGTAQRNFIILILLQHLCLK